MALRKPESKNRKWPKLPSDVPNIFSAAENDDVHSLDLALQFYDVNERDDADMTPLHYAASTLSRRTRDRLLKHPGIDPTLVDKFGRSAATVAFECWGHISDAYVDELNPYCYPWLHEDNPFSHLFPPS